MRGIGAESDIAPDARAARSVWHRRHTNCSCRERGAAGDSGPDSPEPAAVTHLCSLRGNVSAGSSKSVTKSAAHRGTCPLHKSAAHRGTCPLHKSADAAEHVHCTSRLTPLNMLTAQVEVLTGLLEKHGIILEGCNFPSCLTEIVVVLGVANGRHSRKRYMNPRASIAAMATRKVACARPTLCRHQRGAALNVRCPDWG